MTRLPEGVPAAGPEDVLTDAVTLLRDAADLYDARGEPGSAGLLRRLAGALEPDDTDLTEADIDAMMASAAPVLVVFDPEGLERRVTRAVFALKSPAPEGSKHYRSGWDDGLEAAMEAASRAILDPKGQR